MHIPNEQKTPKIPFPNRPQPIIPRGFSDVAAIAEIVINSGTAPKGMNRDSCMVAIMHGLEVGLTPMAALQRIAVVNGRPTIWGDGAIGLVRASGLCEYVKEWVENEGTGAAIAYCETKRRSEQEKVTRSFSVADAQKANLWGKGGPWQQYPSRMLQMRARAFCLRDVYADVLGGLSFREEVEDTHSNLTAQQSQSSLQNLAPPKLSAIQPPPVEPAKGNVIIDAAVEEFNPEQFLQDFDEMLLAVQDGEQLQPLWNEIIEPSWDKLNQSQQDEAQAIFSKHDKRLEQ